MNRRLAWTAGLCSLALLCPLAWPLLTGRLFVFNDLGWFHLPLRYLYQQALTAGDSLLWTPAILAGFYIHGEGQLGLFHPFHQLLYRALPLTVAFNLEILANYAMAFAGMWWLLRRLYISAPAALFGAMLFAFCGFNLLHLHHINVIAVVAHIPWLLAATDVLFSTDDPRTRVAAYVGVALILTSEHLLGFPQGVWWSVMALGGFALLRAMALGRWGRLAACAAAAGTSVLLGGIQILPMLDAAARSVRPLLPHDFSLTYSLHPANLLQLWSPYVFVDRVYSPLDYPQVHELGIYAGAIALVALSWLWIRRKALEGRRSLIAGSVGFAAVALALALGRYGGLDVLLTHLPGLRYMRAPARYIVLVQLALAVTTAIAVDDLATLPAAVRLTRQEFLVLGVPLLLSVATTTLLNSGCLPVGLALPWSTVLRAAGGTLILAAVTTCVWLAARRMRWAIPALIVVTAIDLGCWGIRPVYKQPLQTLAALRAALPPPAAVPSERAYVDDRRLTGDVLVLQNYWLASGYVGLYPATTYSFSDPIAEALSGARWKFSPAGWPTPMPGVGRARLLADQAPPGVARVIVDRPGYIVVDTSAAGRQLLSVSERFHEGWSATSDGHPLQMVAVHADFLGCMVDGGAHRVEFRFMPRSFIHGCILSAIGVLALAIGALVIGRTSGAESHKCP